MKIIFKLCFIISLINNVTYAQETKKEIYTEETYRILATPYEGQESDVPSRVFRLKSDDVTMSLQAASIPDALSRTPGVYIQKTSPDRGTPIIRGFTSSRNVLVADGVRVNNPALREGPNEYWSLLDPFIYQNIEVILGAGSVIYGSDAIGGVVLASTKALSRGIAGQGLQILGGDIYSRYISAQDAFQENFQMRLGYEDNLSFSLGISRSDFGDLHMGETTALPNSSYSSQAVNFRLEYDLDTKSMFVFGYDFFDLDDTNRVHKTPSSKSFHGTTVPGSPSSSAFRIKDIDRHAAFIRYIYRDGNGIIRDADFGLSFQRIEENFRRIRDTGVNHSTRNFVDDTYALNLRIVSDSSIGELTYGFDYYFDQLNSEGVDFTSSGIATKRLQGQIADDVEYHQFGLYLQDKYGISENLDLVLATRYSWVKLNANQVLNVPGNELHNTWQAFTNSAHLVYRFSNDINGYIGVSQGFRAPNVSDTTRDGEFATSGTEAPTADLDPEYYTTYEAGLNISKENYQLGMSVFYTRFKDMIVRQIGAKDNLDGHLSGFEMNGEYWLNKQWSVFANVSFVKTYLRNHREQNINNELTGDQLSKIPPINGQVGLRWKPNNKFYTEAYVSMADEQDDLSQNDRTDDSRIPPGGTPGFATYNLKLGYQFSENMDFALSLENLSDNAYRYHGSGQNAAGRSVIATVHYKF